MKNKFQSIKQLIIILIIGLFTVLPLVSQSNGQDKNNEKKYIVVYTDAKRLVYKKEWQKAIEQFKLVINHLPDSNLVGNALYWQAYSLNRLSRKLENVDKLLEVQSSALEQLEVLIKEFPANKFIDDAHILKVEIAEELVNKGFKEYKRYIENSAKNDNIDMRLIALDALINMDKKKAFPILEKVIFKRLSLAKMCQGLKNVVVEPQILVLLSMQNETSRARKRPVRR